MIWYLSVRFVLFFKQKTAYEMRISDWSSDVCSSDLRGLVLRRGYIETGRNPRIGGFPVPARRLGLGSERRRNPDPRLAARNRIHTISLGRLRRSLVAVFSGAGVDHAPAYR